MNKIRTISTRIDSFMRNGDLTNSPTLQNILNDYCKGVQYVNQRLAQCEMLLQNSKYGEAIIVADRAPSLYELVPLLQAPNILEFFDLCQTYHLQMPQPINLTVFQSLEKALTRSETKDGLFAELRKLSRTQGSEDKVTVLRKIMKLEPDNPEWKRQLRQAESSCVPQLIQAAQQAITNLDFTKLEDLEEALNSSEWQLVIPEVVLEKIHRTLEGESQRELKQRARSIIEDVDKSYAQQNLTDYLRAQSHWKMLCEIDHFVPSEDESHHFAIAESFFSEKQKKAVHEEEYSNIIRQFNGLIQTPNLADSDEVENLYNRLATFDKPIPRNITDFVERIRDEQRTAIRKYRTKVAFRKFCFATISLVLLVVCCAVVWYSYQQKKFIKNLSTALQQEDLVYAGTIVKEIKNSPFPYAKFSEKIKKQLLDFDNMTQDQIAFLKVALDLEKLLDGTPKIEMKGKILALMTECKSKAKSRAAKDKLASLQIKYDENFVKRIQAQQKDHIRDLIGKVRVLFKEYTTKLESKDFSGADTLFAQFKKQAQEIRNIDYFNISDLSEPDQNLLLPFSWLLEKHKVLNRILEDALKNKKLATIQTTLKQYQDNEAELLSVGSFDKMKKSGLPEAAALKKKIDIAQNDETVTANIASLVKLTKDIQACLGTEKLDGIDEKIKEYADLYGKTAKISAISPNVLKDFQKLDKPDVFSSTVEGKRALGASLVSIRKHLKDIDNFNERQTMLNAINRAEQNISLKEKQKETLKALREQILHLSKISDYQRNVSKAIWDNQKYAFFKDLAYSKLYTQKDGEFFSDMKAELEKTIRRIAQNERFYICFRDAKGKIHAWEGDMVKLREGLRASTNGTAGGVSFKVGQETILIEGNQVIIQREIDGAEVSSTYKNVTFIYPQEPTRDNIMNSFAPDQVLVKELKGKLASLPASIISAEYCDFILELKKQEQKSVRQRLELYGIMLKPFNDMQEYSYQAKGESYKPFSNEATSTTLQEVVAAYRKVKDLLSHVKDEPSSLTREEIDSKYMPLLSKIDFACIEKFIKISSEIQAFREALLKSPYVCIGIATFHNQRVDFVQADGILLPSGEVWAFDSNGTCFIAGTSNGKTVTWNDVSQTELHSSIVFVPQSIQNTVTEALKFRNKLSGLGAETTIWPSFFPQNARR